MPSKSIVVVNCGSSSVKIDAFDLLAKDNTASFAIERVGTDKAFLNSSIGGVDTKTELGHVDHAGAVAVVFAELHKGGFEIDAVGHRVVHGGDRFSDSVVVDAAVKAAIQACIPLAPLHNPANLKGIDAVTAALPGIAQVAVFDTAFHQTLPEVAWRYAIPKALADEHGWRRFGFHGTSHRYVAERAAEFFARPIETLRLVTLHHRRRQERRHHDGPHAAGGARDGHALRRR